jgi:hypothetical protein
MFVLGSRLRMSAPGTTQSWLSFHPLPHRRQFSQSHPPQRCLSKPLRQKLIVHTLLPTQSVFLRIWMPKYHPTCQRAGTQVFCKMIVHGWRVRRSPSRVIAAMVLATLLHKAPLMNVRFVGIGWVGVAKTVTRTALSYMRFTLR